MVKLLLLLFLGSVICDTHSLSDGTCIKSTTGCQYELHSASYDLKSELEFHKAGTTLNQISLDYYKAPQINRTISKKSRQNNQISISSLIKSAERKYKIPEGLLLSIAKVETGMKPYTINYNGRGYFFRDVTAAVSFAKSLVAKGVTNFSVGCFQLHYQSHSRRFRSIHDMFNPQKNIDYAAKLLNILYKRRGYNWQRAVKGYHSSYEYSNCLYYSKIVRHFGRAI